MNLGKHGRPKKRPVLGENTERAEHGGGYDNYHIGHLPARNVAQNVGPPALPKPVRRNENE